MSHVRKKCTGLFITTCLYLQTHWITTIYADEQTSCTDRPNWTDAEMDPCSYYEGVSEDGISFCELFGNCCADEEGFTAQTACCVCGEYMLLIHHKLLVICVALYCNCGEH